MAFLLALAACGGGGDSPAAETTPAGPPGTRPLALTADTTPDNTASALGAGEAVLQIGQLVAGYAARFMGQGMPPTTSETCPNGGVITTSLSDIDRNQTASAGDSVTVDWQDCGLALIGEVFSGTFKIDIVAASYGQTSNLAAVAHFDRGATLLGAPAGTTVQLLGSVNVDLTRTDFRTTLDVTSAPADDLRLVARSGRFEITDAFKALALRKDLRLDEARSLVTLAMRYESDSLGGSLTVTTPQPLKAYLNRYPEVGRVELRGAGNALLTVTPNFVSLNQAYRASLDTDGDGVTDVGGNIAWQGATMGFLWWDGTLPVPWGAQPYDTQPFLSTDFTYIGQFMDVPGPEDSFRLQFTRPPLNAPPLQFRFRDNGSNGVYDPNLTDVSATTAHQGALYVVRPDRPLKQRRNYSLDFSVDGLNWFTSATFQDALANTAAIYPYQFGVVTPDNVRAAATVSDGLLDSAQVTLQLDASTSTGNSRPIVAYAWRQLNGTPLTFSAPNSAKTAVRWGATPPKGIENIVIELTVTDAAGEVDTTRKTLAAFDQATAGGVLYFRSAPGDYIGQGQIALVGDTTGTLNVGSPYNGYLQVNYSGLPPDYGTWWTLALATADGSPLRVGAYENAIRAPFHGNLNGIDFGGSGRGCNTISGRYDVRDIATDGNGSITRLAVDFEQHCEGPSAPPLFGSLRINSTIPIRP